MIVIICLKTVLVKKNGVFFSLIRTLGTVDYYEVDERPRKSHEKRNTVLKGNIHSHFAYIHHYDLPACDYRYIKTK